MNAKSYINDANSEYIDLEKLKKETWTGIPQTIPKQRADAWKLLLDYMPIDQGFNNETMNRKREEYHEIVMKYFGGFQSEKVLSN